VDESRPEHSIRHETRKVTYVRRSLETSVRIKADGWPFNEVSVDF